MLSTQNKVLTSQLQQKQQQQTPETGLAQTQRGPKALNHGKRLLDITKLGKNVVKMYKKTVQGERKA